MSSEKATLDEVMEFKENVAKLDDVEKGAILALMVALANGESSRAAVDAANAILAHAGRCPMPYLS